MNKARVVVALVLAAAFLTACTVRVCYEGFCVEIINSANDPLIDDFGLTSVSEFDFSSIAVKTIKISRREFDKLPAEIAVIVKLDHFSFTADLVKNGAVTGYILKYPQIVQQTALDHISASGYPGYVEIDVIGLSTYGVGEIAIEIDGVLVQTIVDTAF